MKRIIPVIILIAYMGGLGLYCACCLFEGYPMVLSQRFVYWSMLIAFLVALELALTFYHKDK